MSEALSVNFFATIVNQKHFSLWHCMCSQLRNGRYAHTCLLTAEFFIEFKLLNFHFTDKILPQKFCHFILAPRRFPAVNSYLDQHRDRSFPDQFIEI